MEKASQASGKTRMSSPSANCNFDQNRIVEHYFRLKEHQHERLATLNMSEELKRRLFGFSESYYLTNPYSADNLIVENHPIKGRIIMTRERYEQYLLQKHKEKELREDEDVYNSVSRVHSDRVAQLSSDLEMALPLEGDSVAMGTVQGVKASTGNESETPLQIHNGDI